MLVGKDVPASAGLRVAMNVGYKDQGAGTITEVVSISSGPTFRNDHTGPGPNCSSSGGKHSHHPVYAGCTSTAPPTD